MAATVYGLASLAALGQADTSAGDGYGGKVPAPYDAGRTAPASGAPARDRVRPLRLVETGAGAFFSFLEGLFGMEQRSEPRRLRQRERDRTLRQPAMRSAPRQDAPPSPPVQLEQVATYRTMCVRLCDGYHWPLSFATSRENFSRDERACLKSCSASVALYYYPNPGGELDDMVNLQGQRYTSLGTAFLYRTVYDPNCKCRPHPWEAAAIERHKSYADREPAARGRDGARPPGEPVSLSPARKGKGRSLPRQGG